MLFLIAALHRHHLHRHGHYPIFSLQDHIQMNFFHETDIPEPLPVSRAPSAASRLVELLLVLVILGILAALVLPKFTGPHRAGAYHCCPDPDRHLRHRARRLRGRHRQLSRAVSDGLQCSSSPQPADVHRLARAVFEERHSRSIRGAGAYIYEFPGKSNPSGYDLRSSGPDGQTNTADDLVNGTVSSR
jgi:general secretion pathway protein G